MYRRLSAICQTLNRKHSPKVCFSHHLMTLVSPGTIFNFQDLEFVSNPWKVQQKEKQLLVYHVIKIKRIFSLRVTPKLPFQRDCPIPERQSQLQRSGLVGLASETNGELSDGRPGINFEHVNFYLTESQHEHSCKPRKHLRALAISPCLSFYLTHTISLI